MKTRLLGNSGCRLEIFEEDTAVRMRKISPNAEYSKRLKKQTLKQKSFAKLNPISQIKVPQVLFESNNSIYFFEMEYFHSLDFISFLQQAEKNELDICIKNLKSYISYIIEQSTDEVISSQVFLEKYDEVKKNTRKNSIFTDAERTQLFLKTDPVFLSLPSTLLLPIGLCHGDLSFSNILFNKKSQELIFIDFLDNFVETPLQDMVKLMQDLQFYWSFNFYSDSYDRTKVELALDYMFIKFEQFFNTYSFYKQQYRFFQLLNILRIFPYVSQLHVKDYLLRTIDQVLELPEKRS